MPNYPYGLKNTDHECLREENNQNLVEFECVYSGWGWLLFSIGMSARPSRVDFICRKCNQVIDSTSELVVLKKYVGR